MGAKTPSVDAFLHELEMSVPGARKAVEELIVAARRIFVEPAVNERSTSLMLIWRRTATKLITLGYISKPGPKFKRGGVWNGPSDKFVPLDLIESYANDLADTWGVHVEKIEDDGLVAKEGKTVVVCTGNKPKTLPLGEMVPRLGAWLAPMERFIAAVQRHEAGGGQETIASSENSNPSFEATDVDTAIEEALEGGVNKSLRQTWERSTELVKLRKARSSDHLVCEACGFDFKARYGERGDGFIECHHTNPGAARDDVTLTQLDDLALLCANCHRMIHTRQPWLTVSGLKELLSRTATGYRSPRDKGGNVVPISSEP